MQKKEKLNTKQKQKTLKHQKGNKNKLLNQKQDQREIKTHQTKETKQIGM